MSPQRQPRILVVDDERSFADLLTTVLEEEGYAVDCAYDGEQAWRLLQSARPPDLVLSDVMLPKLSGTGLLAAARRVPALQQVPFVLLSAGPDPGVRADRVSFLAKPLDLDQLLAQVAAVVDSSSNAPALP